MATYSVAVMVAANLIVEAKNRSEAFKRAASGEGEIEHLDYYNNGDVVVSKPRSAALMSQTAGASEPDQVRVRKSKIKEIELTFCRGDLGEAAEAYNITDYEWRQICRCFNDTVDTRSMIELLQEIALEVVKSRKSIPQKGA